MRTKTEKNRDKRRRKKDRVRKLGLWSAERQMQELVEEAAAIEAALNENEIEKAMGGR